MSDSWKDILNNHREQDLSSDNSAILTESPQIDLNEGWGNKIDRKWDETNNKHSVWGDSTWMSDSFNDNLHNSNSNTNSNFHWETTNESKFPQEQNKLNAKWESTWKESAVNTDVGWESDSINNILSRDNAEVKNEWNNNPGYNTNYLSERRNVWYPRNVQKATPKPSLFSTLLGNIYHVFKVKIVYSIF